MNEAVEFHDADLAEIEVLGDDLVVRLRPGYVHRSEGRPGLDPRSGWVADVDLIVRAGQLLTPPPDLPCELSDGDLNVGGTAHENILPLPFDAAGLDLLLRFETTGGASIAIRGDRIEVMARGVARYVEEFPGL